MFSLGMPNTEIGERLGVTEGAIRKRLLKLGLVKNKSSNRYIQKILEKKKEGVSNTQIAKLLSISEGYVRKILKSKIRKKQALIHCSYSRELNKSR